MLCFVCSLGPKGGYTGDFYAWVITHKVVPAVYEVLGHLEKGPLFQDDEAVIHRTKAAMAATSVMDRMDPKKLAPKMADVWPIEQVNNFIICN